MTRKCYVTTTIPYVNAKPHVGFALELVQADALARYHRLLGRDVRLQTGTDENALKNVLAASERGVATQHFVDDNARAFRDLCPALGVAPDEFVRTTEPRHRRAVERFWQRLRADDIYRKKYTGLYCVGCEDFVLERDLVDGCCVDHGKPPVRVDEENYFFRLSTYQSQVEDLIRSDRLRIVPQTRRNEVLAFVRQGLQDISVSRLAARAGGWGIPVPGDPSQVIYVWIDALINYVSGLGFGTSDGWDEYWNDDTLKIHVMGKNVWKFHAVYWPALLLSAGLPVPDVVAVHGFLTQNGQKISKTLGNTIDPVDCVREFGLEAVRYYLLRAIPSFDDGDFSTERLKGVYNADLANGLGNLVSRLTTLCSRAGFCCYVGAASPAAPEGYHEAWSRYEYDGALAALWKLITVVNQEIDRAAPWAALKAKDPGSVHGHLERWLGVLHSIAYWLAPFVPRASQTILEMLARDPIVPSAPLFPRLVYLQ